MSYILLQNEGPNAGNFVLKDTGKPDVVLGDYLEVSYIGPESKTHIPEGPGGYTVYGFPLVVRHSLIHNDDVESVLLHKDWPHVWEFRTTLACEAVVLLQLKHVKTQRLRAVKDGGKVYAYTLA